MNFCYEHIFWKTEFQSIRAKTDQVTAAQLGYLSTTTSDVQTQLTTNAIDIAALQTKVSGATQWHASLLGATRMVADRMKPADSFVHVLR